MVNGDTPHSTGPTPLLTATAWGVQVRLTMAFLALWPQRGRPIATTDAPYGPALVCCAATTPAKAHQRHTTLLRLTNRVFINAAMAVIHLRVPI